MNHRTAVHSRVLGRRALTALAVGVALTLAAGTAQPASAAFGAMHEPITGTVSSNFNRCNNASTHHGIDIAAPVGRNVFSAYRGTVRFAGNRGDGYGITVVMSHHDRTYWTRYAHLSQITVKVGDFVGRGVKIAESGNTGASEGPHLHFEVRTGGEWGTPLNMDSAYPCGKSVTAKDPIPFRFEGLPA